MNLIIFLILNKNRGINVEKIELPMTGKIILITGANAGLGKETAIQLAKKGATIIMACRNEKRALESLKEIKEKSGSEKIELYIVDLADQDSIRSMVSDFKKSHDKLHVLINNAGVMLDDRIITKKAYEMTFAINHLGHFLLTNLLLDIIMNSSPSRIINVSSIAHKFASLDLDNINLNEGFSGLRAYSNSKLMNLLFTYELARRLEGTYVTVNALHPGKTKTKLTKPDGNWLKKIFFAFLRIFFIDVEKGAKTSIYLASSPEVKNITGTYFVKSKPARPSKKSRDKTLQKRLWGLSEDLTSYPLKEELEYLEEKFYKKIKSECFS